MQKAVGYTCDRVYRWRLLLEEFGPEIVWIKGIDNTVADALSRLDYSPVKDTHQNWMMFAKSWCFYTHNAPLEPPDYEDSLNFVFANTQEDDGIFPLTVAEIAEAQGTDSNFLNILKKDKKEKYVKQLVGDIKLYCCEGKLVIPKSLQRRAVEWFHHYLQHPGSTQLEETLRGSMYWKGMRPTSHCTRLCQKL
eukprot:scaffold35257_cov38-Cyclotella_meneghiniana.AAC.1